MKPLIATIARLSACNNVSKYAIDNKSVTKIDPILLQHSRFFPL